MKNLFGEDFPSNTIAAPQSNSVSSAVKAPRSLPPVCTSSPVEEILGTADDGYVCPDAACRGTAHDIVAEDQGYWKLECAFCGTGQWVRAKRGIRLEQQGEFRFRGGRFDGMTLPEVARSRRGDDYLAWAAEKHPRQFVREAVKKWLTSRGVGG